MNVRNQSTLPHITIRTHRTLTSVLSHHLLMVASGQELCYPEQSITTCPRQHRMDRLTYYVTAIWNLRCTFDAFPSETETVGQSPPQNGTQHPEHPRRNIQWPFCGCTPVLRMGEFQRAWCRVRVRRRVVILNIAERWSDPRRNPG